MSALAFNIATFLIRFILGFFFVAYRFRWVYDPSQKTTKWLSDLRHMSLEKKLCSCGWGMHPILAGFVALVELSAGLGVMTGTLTYLSAFGLMAILLVATSCTAKHKIEIQNNGQGPIDAIDVVSCYLWTVEPIYILLAILVLLLGPGAWSLDALFLNALIG